MGGQGTPYCLFCVIRIELSYFFLQKIKVYLHHTRRFPPKDDTGKYYIHSAWTPIRLFAARAVELDVWGHDF